MSGPEPAQHRERVRVQAPVRQRKPGTQSQPGTQGQPGAPSHQGHQGHQDKLGTRGTQDNSSLRHELDEHSQTADVLVRSLIRSQFRLAAVVASGFLILLLSVPVLMALFPEINSVAIAGIPLPWLLLGFLAYVLTIACGYLFYRAAERNERRFDRLMSE